MSLPRNAEPQAGSASAASEPSRAPDGLPASVPALDAEVLASLRALAQATDISLLREIIDAFLSDSTMRLESLRWAVASGDIQVLKQAAHALQGSSANIGAKAMAALSEKLQTAGDKNSVEGAAPLIEQLEEELARARAELEAELQG